MVEWGKQKHILDAFDDYLGVSHPNQKAGLLRAYSLVKIVQGDAAPRLVTPPRSEWHHLHVGVGWLVEHYPELVPDLLEEMLS